jgi:hypothetical protein
MVGYSKDDIGDMHITKLMPLSIQAEHSRCFDEYLKTGISEKIFRKSQAVFVRSDGLGQMTDMWLKPYIHLSPFKPVLLSISRKVTSDGLFYLVTDGLGYVDCVSQEYNNSFSSRFLFNDQINSIFYYAPDLLTYFFEVSLNLKGRLPVEEVMLDKSTTRISQRPTIANETIIKLDWFQLNKPCDDSNNSTLHRKLWERSSFNLTNIIGKIKSIPRSNKEVFRAKIKISHQHLKNGTSMFFISLISFGDKKLMSKGGDDTGKNTQSQFIKVDSIEAHIEVKDNPSEEIENTSFQSQRLKFSSCVNTSSARVDQEKKPSKIISASNVGVPTPAALMRVHSRFKLIKNLVDIGNIIKNKEPIDPTPKADLKEANIQMQDNANGDQLWIQQTERDHYNFGPVKIPLQKRGKFPFMSVWWQQARLLLAMSGIICVFLVASIVVFQIVS